MTQYFVYILYSEGRGKHYVGSCKNTEKRLAQHNTGRVRATKYGVPWTLIYREIFDTRQQAYYREHQIKSYKGGEAFRRLLNKS
ncbi:MAG: GIY-YIG nuclease family protein [bacterium]|nr:GIY-YIG nuclease family protein [bacterium]